MEQNAGDCRNGSVEDADKKRTSAAHESQSSHHVVEPCGGQLVARKEIKIRARVPGRCDGRPDLLVALSVIEHREHGSLKKGENERAKDESDRQSRGQDRAHRAAVRGWRGGPEGIER